MIADNVENYEVLSILGSDTSSSCYKVKNKITSEIQTWRAVTYDDSSEKEKKMLFEKISKYMELKNPYIMKIHGYIHQKNSNIVYLVSDYYSKGSVEDIINFCKKQKKRISENFIWRVLYQMSCFIKFTNHSTNLRNSRILVDGNLNIKVFSFKFLETDKTDTTEQKLFLGQLILGLCTLELEVKKQNYDSMCDMILQHFSDELVEIISFMLKRQTDINEMVNTILCHPTVLLKSNFFLTEKDLYVDIAVPSDDCIISVMQNIKNITLEQSRKDTCVSEGICSQVENVKNREIILKNREHKLMEKEFKLKKREKKIALMEKMAKEKLLQLDLYLRNNQENVPPKNSSNKDDDSDASYPADYTVLNDLPTSVKPNIDNFTKPSVFVRTRSERRVKFKAHSPLKEKTYISNMSKSSCLCDLTLHSEKNNLCKNSEGSSWHTASSETNSEKSFDNAVKERNNFSKISGISSWQTVNSDINSDKSFNNIIKEKKKSLFSSLTSKRKPILKDKSVARRNSLELQDNSFSFNKTTCRPISWTEDSKKQAFELLKLMNSTRELDKESIPMKHTKL